VSTMESLIRLHRWQVDERRRHVAELEGLAERLREDLGHLAEEQRGEAAAAAASLEAKFGYAGYIRQVMERQRTLEQSLADLETQIAQARDALAQAFEELKRYETAAANRERLRLQRIKRREGIELDALAIENFRRRSGGEQPRSRSEGYSIASSTRSSTDEGSARPSPFAAFMLTISANLVAW